MLVRKYFRWIMAFGIFTTFLGAHRYGSFGEPNPDHSFWFVVSAFGVLIMLAARGYIAWMDGK